MDRLIPSMISETEFIDGLSALIEYYEKFGSLKNIRPAETYEYEGKLIYIGAFVRRLKMEHEKGLLDKAIAEPLHNMGIEWEYDTIAPLRAYYKEFGTIANIKKSTIYNYQGENIKVGTLISYLRTKYNKGKLNKDIVIELEQMGMAWNYDRIAILRAYYNEFGTMENIKYSDTYNYQGERVKIGTLINHLRVEYNKGKLAKEEIIELEQMGMAWNYDRIAILRAYYKEFGTIATIKQSTIYNYHGEEVKIGALINSLRVEYNKGKLSQAKINELESMGMVWKKVFEFDDRIAPLIAYYKEFGTISNVKINCIYKYNGKDIKIGKLINHLRAEYYNGKLADEEINKLESMGMIWRVRVRFNNKMGPLIAYYEEFGTIANIETDDIYIYQGKEVNIGLLISNLRRPERRKGLTKEEIEILNSMGMIWSVNVRFEDRLEPLRAYYNEFGTIANIKYSTIYNYQGEIVKIGERINHLRAYYKKGKLDKEEIIELDQMGMIWDASFRRAHKRTQEDSINNDLKI